MALLTTIKDNRRTVKMLSSVLHTGLELSVEYLIEYLEL